MAVSVPVRTFVRLKVRLTVNGLRGQTSITERTKYDVFYVENWSLAFDVKILLKTIGAIFRDKNAY